MAITTRRDAGAARLLVTTGGRWNPWKKINGSRTTGNVTSASLGSAAPTTERTVAIERQRLRRGVLERQVITRIRTGSSKIVGQIARRTTCHRHLEVRMMANTDQNIGQ
jgi:hypothetical protein